MLQRRSMIHVSLALVALIIIIYPYFSNKPDPEKVEQASVAAQTFLELLDNGNYEEAWRQSATFMRQDVPLETWLAQLHQIRSQVGALRERNQSDVDYTKEQVEGIPEGEYLSFFYNSRFDHQTTARERVTLYHEAATSWRVAGYFIE